MSSELTVLRSKDLLTLKTILDAAGFGPNSSASDSKRFNQATSLLAGHFFRGMTSEKDLIWELEKHFGASRSPFSPPSFELNRAAVQGRPLP